MPTVMWNYIRSLYDRIRIAGSEPMLSSTGPLPEDVENGLVGEVRILPYVVRRVDV